MEKEVCFRYKSIGNFVRLLTTIRFENTHDAAAIAVWHERFDEDDEESDAIFEGFLVELFPEGKMIEVEDIESVMYRAERFLEKDEKARHIRNAQTKRRNAFWVYFKPDDTVYPCEYAEHSKIITDICVDFFKGFDTLDVDYLKKFIVDNFEIASDNSTVERIAKDARFILAAILIERG